MFLIEEAIKSVLTDDAGVSAAVGNRVYGGYLTQTTQLPAVAYRQIGEDVLPTMTANDGHPGHVMRRMRFFSTSKGVGKYLEAKQVDEAIRLALHGYSGTVTNSLSPSESITIQGIFSENCIDLFDADTQIHQIVRDFAVWATETHPNH